MKKEMDLVEMFNEEAHHNRLCDLQPEYDPIKEEREYQDGFFRVLLETKINFKRGHKND